jgi:hypothetical protein
MVGKPTAVIGMGRRRRRGGAMFSKDAIMGQLKNSSKYLNQAANVADMFDDPRAKTAAKYARQGASFASKLGYGRRRR